MLVFGWLLFGLAGLFAASAILSMAQKPGTYVSPLGALTFLTTGKAKSSPWPWGQTSVTGIIGDAGKAAAGGVVSDLTGGAL